MERIDAAAFAVCANLKSVDIAASVRTLGDSLFMPEPNTLSRVETVIFRGDCVDMPGEPGLDPAICTVYAPGEAAGWADCGYTWKDVPLKCVIVGKDGHEYLALEYIESTKGGGQYIDTGYIHKANTKIVCEVNAAEGQERDWAAAFGACNVYWGSNAFAFYIQRCR